MRTAAAVPLRHALEMHDPLSVLSAYGTLSSIAALLTGILIFGENAGWSQERSGAYFLVVGVHWWGMHSLGRPAQDGRVKQSDEGSKLKGSVQMEMTRVYGSETGVHQSPLLRMNDQAPRTVEEDARIEEQLFAHALVPQNLPPATGSTMGGADDKDAGWIASWPSESSPPLLDADFEEIMRRFNEDDQKSGSNLEAFFPGNMEKTAPVEPLPESVITLDAQTLLDVSSANMDDEDELLKSIEDIPEL